MGSMQKHSRDEVAERDCCGSWMSPVFFRRDPEVHVGQVTRTTATASRSHTVAFRVGSQHSSNEAHAPKAHKKKHFHLLLRLQTLRPFKHPRPLPATVFIRQNNKTCTPGGRVKICKVWPTAVIAGHRQSSAAVTASGLNCTGREKNDPKLTKTSSPDHQQGRGFLRRAALGSWSTPSDQAKTSQHKDSRSHAASPAQARRPPPRPRSHPPARSDKNGKRERSPNLSIVTAAHLSLLRDSDGRADAASMRGLHSARSVSNWRADSGPPSRFKTSSRNESGPAER